MKWLKQLFCRHKLDNLTAHFYQERLVYINGKKLEGDKRIFFKCKKCGKFKEAS